MGGGVGPSWARVRPTEAEGATDGNEDVDDEVDRGRRDWEGSVPVMPPVLITLDGVSPRKWLVPPPFLLEL